MSKMNGAGKKARSNGAAGKAAAGIALSQKPPKNARVVKSSAKTGTFSRSAARAAVKAVMANRDRTS